MPRALAGTVVAPPQIHGSNNGSPRSTGWIVEEIILCECKFFIIVVGGRLGDRCRRN